jgi:hypothetical protein
MKTTKMQLANFAIRIIKEVARSPKHIGVDYSTKQTVTVWFYKEANGTILKYYSLYGFISIKENIKIYKQIIKEIRR